jgi:hypothetical protein
MPFKNYAITKGGQLTIGQILSPNFVHGVSGWEIRKDGSAEFQNVILPTGSGGNVITISAGAPSGSGITTGDLWFDLGTGVLYYWTGSAWVVFQYGTGSIANQAITAAQIANATITGAQLAVSVTARSLNGITTTISATAPGSPVTGDIWIDTANGSQLQQWSGSAWVPITWTATDVISANTITAALIAANTITAGQIAANTITASQIAANTITAAQIAANTITAAQIAANTITAAQIAANTITVSQLAAGIIYAGIVNGTTITGASLVADGSSGNILIYSGPPALGNLIGSWSAAAGTDSSGNAFSANLEVGAAGSPQVLINPNNPLASGASLQVPTNATDEGFPFSVFSQPLTIVSNGQAYLISYIAAPANVNDSTGSQMALVFASPTDDNTTSEPSLILTDLSTAFPYLVATNAGPTNGPALGIGGAVPGSAIPDFIGGPPIAGSLNGFLAGYGAGGQQTTVTLSGAGNFTVPAGITSIIVKCWGGGAGGAGAANAPTGGGEGGGGGAYASSTLTVTPLASIPYSVGAGGAGGAANTLGSDGHDTTWNTSTVVAKKGLAATIGSVGLGGTAAASTGTTKHSGGNGGAATGTGGSGGGGSGGPNGGAGAGQSVSGSTGGTGGNPGSGGGATGGKGGNTGVAGSAGNAPGAGGGGGGDGGSPKSGGAGANGKITVTYTMAATVPLVAIASAASTDLLSNSIPAGLTVFGSSSGHTNMSAASDGHLKLDNLVEIADTSAPSTPLSGTKVYSGTGLLKFVSEDGNAYTTGRRTVYFTGTQTVSSATFVTVTDGTNNFSATVAAAAYKFRTRLIYKLSGTTGTCSFGLSGPAFSSGGAGMTLVFNGIASGFGRYDNASPLASSFGSVANATLGTSLFCLVDIEGQFVFSASGTLAIRAQTGAGGSSFVIQQGSFFELEPL